MVGEPSGFERKDYDGAAGFCALCSLGIGCGPANGVAAPKINVGAAPERGAALKSRNTNAKVTLAVRDSADEMVFEVWRGRRHHISCSKGREERQQTTDLSSRKCDRGGHRHGAVRTRRRGRYVVEHGVIYAE